MSSNGNITQNIAMSPSSTSTNISPLNEPHSTNPTPVSIMSHITPDINGTDQLDNTILDLSITTSESPPFQPYNSIFEQYSISHSKATQTHHSSFHQSATPVHFTTDPSFPTPTAPKYETSLTNKGAPTTTPTTPSNQPELTQRYPFRNTEARKNRLINHKTGQAEKTINSRFSFSKRPFLPETGRKFGVKHIHGIKSRLSHPQTPENPTTSNFQQAGYFPSPITHGGLNLSQFNTSYENLSNESSELAATQPYSSHFGQIPQYNDFHLNIAPITKDDPSTHNNHRNYDFLPTHDSLPYFTFPHLQGSTAFSSISMIHPGSVPHTRPPHVSQHSHTSSKATTLVNSPVQEPLDAAQRTFNRVYHQLRPEQYKFPPLPIANSSQFTHLSERLKNPLEAHNFLILLTQRYSAHVFASSKLLNFHTNSHNSKEVMDFLQESLKQPQYIPKYAPLLQFAASTLKLTQINFLIETPTFRCPGLRLNYATQCLELDLVQVHTPKTQLFYDTDTSTIIHGPTGRLAPAGATTGTNLLLSLFSKIFLLDYGDNLFTQNHENTSGGLFNWDNRDSDKIDVEKLLNDKNIANEGCNSLISAGFSPFGTPYLDAIHKMSSSSSSSSSLLTPSNNKALDGSVSRISSILHTPTIVTPSTSTTTPNGNNSSSILSWYHRHIPKLPINKQAIQNTVRKVWKSLRHRSTGNNSSSNNNSAIPANTSLETKNSPLPISIDPSASPPLKSPPRAVSTTVLTTLNIPFSHIAGIDFSISLTQPGEFSISLKKQSPPLSFDPQESLIFPPQLYSLSSASTWHHLQRYSFYYILLAISLTCFLISLPLLGSITLTIFLWVAARLILIHKKTYLLLAGVDIYQALLLSNMVTVKFMAQHLPDLVYLREVIYQPTTARVFKEKSKHFLGGVQVMGPEKRRNHWNSSKKRNRESEKIEDDEKNNKSSFWSNIQLLGASTPTRAFRESISSRPSSTESTSCDGHSDYTITDLETTDGDVNNSQFYTDLEDVHCNSLQTKLINLDNQQLNTKIIEAVSEHPQHDPALVPSDSTDVTVNNHELTFDTETLHVNQLNTSIHSSEYNNPSTPPAEIPPLPGDSDGDYSDISSIGSLGARSSRRRSTKRAKNLKQSKRFKTLPSPTSPPLLNALTYTHPPTATYHSLFFPRYHMAHLYHSRSTSHVIPPSCVNFHGPDYQLPQADPRPNTNPQQPALFTAPKTPPKTDEPTIHLFDETAFGDSINGINNINLVTTPSRHNINTNINILTSQPSNFSTFPSCSVQADGALPPTSQFNSQIPPHPFRSNDSSPLSTPQPLQIIRAPHLSPLLKQTEYQSFNQHSPILSAHEITPLSQFVSPTVFSVEQPGTSAVPSTPSLADETFDIHGRHVSAFSSIDSPPSALNITQSSEEVLIYPFNQSSNLSPILEPVRDPEITSTPLFHSHPELLQVENNFAISPPLDPFPSINTTITEFHSATTPKLSPHGLILPSDSPPLNHCTPHLIGTPFLTNCSYQSNTGIINTTAPTPALNPIAPAIHISVSSPKIPHEDSIRNDFMNFQTPQLPLPQLLPLPTTQNHLSSSVASSTAANQSREKQSQQRGRTNTRRGSVVTPLRSISPNLSLSGPNTSFSPVLYGYRNESSMSRDPGCCSPNQPRFVGALNNLWIIECTGKQFTPQITWKNIFHFTTRYFTLMFIVSSFLLVQFVLLVILPILLYIYRYYIAVVPDDALTKREIVLQLYRDANRINTKHHIYNLNIFRKNHEIGKKTNEQEKSTFHPSPVIIIDQNRDRFYQKYHQTSPSNTPEPHSNPNNDDFCQSPFSSHNADALADTTGKLFHTQSTTQTKQLKIFLLIKKILFIDIYQKSLYMLLNLLQYTLYHVLTVNSYNLYNKFSGKPTSLNKSRKRGDSSQCAVNSSNGDVNDAADDKSVESDKHLAEVSRLGELVHNTMIRLMMIQLSSSNPQYSMLIAPPHPKKSDPIRSNNHESDNLTTYPTLEDYQRMNDHNKLHLTRSASQLYPVPYVTFTNDFTNPGDTPEIGTKSLEIDPYWMNTTTIYMPMAPSQLKDPNLPMKPQIACSQANDAFNSFYDVTSPPMVTPADFSGDKSYDKTSKNSNTEDSRGESILQKMPLVMNSRRHVFPPLPSSPYPNTSSAIFNTTIPLQDKASINFHNNNDKKNYKKNNNQDTMTSSLNTSMMPNIPGFAETDDVQTQEFVSSQYFLQYYLSLLYPQHQPTYPLSKEFKQVYFSSLQHFISFCESQNTQTTQRFKTLSAHHSQTDMLSYNPNNTLSQQQLDDATSSFVSQFLLNITTFPSAPLLLDNSYVDNFLAYILPPYFFNSRVFRIILKFSLPVLYIYQAISTISTTLLPLLRLSWVKYLLPYFLPEFIVIQKMFFFVLYPLLFLIDKTVLPILPMSLKLLILTLQSIQWALNGLHYPIHIITVFSNFLSTFVKQWVQGMWSYREFVELSQFYTHFQMLQNFLNFVYTVVITLFSSVYQVLSLGVNSLTFFLSYLVTMVPESITQVHSFLYVSTQQTYGLSPSSTQVSADTAKNTAESTLSFLSWLYDSGVSAVFSSSPASGAGNVVQNINVLSNAATTTSTSATTTFETIKNLGSQMITTSVGVGNKFKAAYEQLTRTQQMKEDVGQQPPDDTANASIIPEAKPPTPSTSASGMITPRHARSLSIVSSRNNPSSVHRPSHTPTASTTLSTSQNTPPQSLVTVVPLKSSPPLHPSQHLFSSQNDLRHRRTYLAASTNTTDVVNVYDPNNHPHHFPYHNFADESEEDGTSEEYTDDEDYVPTLAGSDEDSVEDVNENQELQSDEANSDNDRDDHEIYTSSNIMGSVFNDNSDSYSEESVSFLKDEFEDYELPKNAVYSPPPPQKKQ